MKYSRERGISLLEIMLVLVVAAGIIIAASRYFTVTRLNQQVNEAATMINNVYVAALQYSNNNDLSTINISTLINGGSLPADFDNSEANPWSGSISAAGAGNVLTVTLSNVPEKACANLTARFSSPTSSSAVCNPNSGAIRSFIVTFNLGVNTSS